MVREAMFSALDARGAIAGASVLDLYAGTGALGIEALSRGADRVVAVEHDARARGALSANVKTTGFSGQSRLAHGTVSAFLGAVAPPEAPFDLVFVDPPYDMPDDDVLADVRALLAPGWLEPHSFVSIERPAGARVVAPAPLRTTWERTFGDTLVLFLTAEAS
jgi:16S rRNA (guanine966-N2)-methyltransferase